MIFRQMSVCVVLGVAALGQHAAAQNDADAVGESAIEAIRSQFSQLSAVSFEAAVEMRLVKRIGGAGIAVDEPILGAFEYAALGSSWKKRSQMDTALYPAMDTSVGYDGQWYWYKLHDTDTMGISSSGDIRTSGMTLPNPIFAVAQWLAPTNEADDLTINEVKGKAAQGEFERLSAWDWVEVADQQMAAADFKGAIMDRVAYDVRVFVREFAGQPLPAIIELIDGDGVRVRAIFDNYETFGTDDGTQTRWPRTFEFRAYDPLDGGEVGWMSMEILNLTVSELALQDVTFSPPIADTEHVWFQEGEGFIK